MSKHNRTGSATGITPLRALMLVCGIFASEGNLAIAAEASFVYRLLDLPVVQGVECDEYAMNLGTRLTEYARRNKSSKTPDASEIQVLDARCFTDAVTNDAPSWNVEITYASAEKLALVSTMDVEAGLFSVPQFDNLKSCEAALELEMVVFERQTGLSPFIGYCRVQAYAYSSEVRATPIIDGFGEPSARPYNTGTELFGRLLGHSWTSFKALITERFTSLGAEVATMALSSHMVYSDLQIRYYGRESIRMTNYTIAKSATPEQCESERAIVDSALEQSGVFTFGTFCSTGTIGNEFEIMTITNSDRTLRLASPSTLYADFAACTAAKPAVEDQYRNRFKRNVITAVCGFDSDANAYHINVLEKSGASS